MKLGMYHVNVQRKKGTKKGGDRMSKMRIKAENLTVKELRDHELFEEGSDWLDVFAETPEVIVPDFERMVFWIWFGGESHYVHKYSQDGREFDVFSFGFDKNKLCKEEVLESIEDTLNDLED